jgi:arsenate reductase-like glutaredoxin family protein
MPTPAELATAYANKIRAAVAKDQASRTAGLIKTAADLASNSQLATAFREIGKEVERLSETEKQTVIDQTAGKLQQDPKVLRRIIKSGSVDSLMTVSQELEDVFRTVKK